MSLLNIHSSFDRFQQKPGGRTVIQLTSGPGFCYPLYYFIPSVTADGRYVVHHRAEGGQVQLYRLDLQTGASRQITRGTGEKTQWFPWCSDAGHGVLDHRSVLDAAGHQVVYFNDREVRAVELDSLEDRLLFTIPAGRQAIGQNCVTPDGQWFVYIHANEVEHTELRKRCENRGTALCAFHLHTGEHRTLVYLNSPIHHVVPYGNEHVLFCHPATENGMLLTDLQGGWYTHLRTMDASGGTVCHFTATAAGIAYEVLKPPVNGKGKGAGTAAGIYNPFAHRNYEFRLPEQFGYTHTGSDPEGRLWFFENSSGDDCHELWFLAQHDAVNGDRWELLLDHWPTYGKGQKSHFHPRLTPDRKWILFTAGDPRHETNHMYLLDVADLRDTTGIPPV